MISTGLLVWLVAAIAPAGARAPSRAEISTARTVALRAAMLDEPRAAAPHARSRTVRVERVGDRTRVTATWLLDGPKAGGWFADTLVRGNVRVRSVTIDGRPAAVVGDGDTTAFAAWVDGPASVELVGDLLGDPDREPVALALMPAVRGVATVVAPATWEIEGDAGTALVDVGGDTIGGASALRVVARAPEAPGEQLVVGHVGVGLWVGEAETRGHARLQWVVRRGELAAVSFDARNVGDDFDVRGPDVREVRRNGDRFEVDLQAPATSIVTLDATWSLRTPPGDAELPTPAFELGDVTRSDASFELGREGDIDVEPRMTSWRPVASAALPTWGRDLVDGASAAAWVRHEGASPTSDDRLRLLRFVPVEAPDVVVAEAEFEAASADHGITLVKARYAVLNERASHLRVRLGDGTRLLAVEVSGRDADVAKDDDAYLIPVPRSLETLEGLITIPVVVTVAVEAGRWRRRDRRELPLPSIDAPIRAVRAQWLLPRDFKAQVDAGEDGVVSVSRVPRHRPRHGFSRSKKVAADAGAAGTALYDFADDGVEGAEMEVDGELIEAENDQLLSEAQAAYTSNDFGKAQQRVDELRSRGGKDEDVEKLQSNLDIVNAPVDAKAPEPAAASPAKTGLLRRIKDQARARGQKQVIQLEQRKEKAKELRSKGEYKKAEEEYRRAIEDARQLEALEQDESGTYDFEAEELAKELETTTTEASTRAALDAPQSSDPPPPPPSPPPSDATAEHGFGAPWLVDEALVAELDEPGPASLRSDGPRVLMPRRGGDTVYFSFDLWGPGKAGRLTMKSRRRVRRG